LIRTILFFLGIVSFSIGSVTAFSAISHSTGPTMSMDGPFDHALSHQESGQSTKDCADKDGGMNCDDCDMAACNMSGCSLTVLASANAVVWVKIRMTNTPAAPPAVAGLNRHNLPLPPP